MKTEPRTPYPLDALRRARSPREDGIALFIVLVLVLVLTIVIFQLTFTTKIEERISRNRQGFLELSYTLQAVARSALQQLETDLMEDLGLIEEETDEDLDDTPGGPGQDPGNTGQPGTGNPGAGRDSERFDLRHEEWAHVINENLNGASAVVRILDGEGRIDLNFLFEYPQYPEEVSDDDTTPPDSADENPTDPDLEEEEEEWVPPSSEQVDDAKLIVSRLIQALIAANEDAGFIYQETPDPDAAADEIVNWVQQRIEEPSTRLIRSMKPLLRLETVSHELFFGPKPEEEEEEDGFEDEDDLFSQMTEEMGEMPGFEQFDEGVEEVPRPLGLRDVMTAHSIGKLNLNTARPEVYVALMLQFDDFDEALEIALLIDEHLNSYKVEDEEGGEPAGTPAGTEEEEDTEEFNQFSTFSDLGDVDETWSEGDETDDTILELLEIDLGPIAVYQSTYFTVQVDGELEGRKMRGVMAAARVEKDIIVLSWEEADR